MTATLPTSFAYHRSISPTLSVLLVLALLETAVMHVAAVALWGWRVAIVLAVLDLSAVAAMVSLLRAIRRQPVTLSGGVLTMRVGNLRVIPIPVDNIAGVRASWDAAALKRRDVANLALATWPNVVLDLSEPVKVRRRNVRTVAHKLDDPAALLQALGLQRPTDQLVSSSVSKSAS